MKAVKLHQIIDDLGATTWEISVYEGEIVYAMHLVHNNAEAMMWAARWLDDYKPARLEASLSTSAHAAQ